MDSTVIGEDMEMQVVVVTHNVLPIRSLRWQNIPSSLPVECKVYSCGRVRHKRGQQNSSKCLDKRLFYPYIPCVSSPCPPLPSLSSHSFCYPTCEVNFVYGYTIMKKFEREKSYWYHWLIRLSPSGCQWTCSVGTQPAVVLSRKAVNPANFPDSALTSASRGYKTKDDQGVCVGSHSISIRGEEWANLEVSTTPCSRRKGVPKTLCNYLIQMFGES